MAFLLHHRDEGRGGRKVREIRLVAKRRLHTQALESRNQIKFGIEGDLGHHVGYEAVLVLVRVNGKSLGQALLIGKQVVHRHAFGRQHERHHRAARERQTCAQEVVGLAKALQRVDTLRHELGFDVARCGVKHGGRGVRRIERIHPTAFEVHRVDDGQQKVALGFHLGVDGAARILGNPCGHGLVGSVSAELHRKRRGVELADRRVDERLLEGGVLRHPYGIRQIDRGERIGCQHAEQVAALLGHVDGAGRTQHRGDLVACLTSSAFVRKRQGVVQTERRIHAVRLGTVRAVAQHRSGAAVGERCKRVYEGLIDRVLLERVQPCFGIVLRRLLRNSRLRHGELARRTLLRACAQQCAGCQQRHQHCSQRDRLSCKAFAPLRPSIHGVPSVRLFDPSKGNTIEATELSGTR